MAVTMNYGAAPTYVKIASPSLSGLSSVTFSNIPQGYTDLVLVTNSQNVTTQGYPYLRFNGDSGSNYSTTFMVGNGTAASSSRYTSITELYLSNSIAGSLTANFSFNCVANIQSYNNSTTYKTVMSKEGNTNGVEANVGVWRNTSAITSILFAVSGGTFASGSTVTLYGIKAALVPKASGGDIIVQDGTYWYHAFRTTGAFVPRQSLTADMLVVAGGGGSKANYGGGGGGGGGVVALTSQSLTSTTYTVTIGGGGSGRANGSNSQFGSLTAAIGGGFGGTQAYGAETAVSGQNGGSGGGGGSGTSIYAGGTGSQGNNGGSGTNTSTSSQWAGGGGGGAGGAGGNASSQTGGAGGAGTSTYSSWGAATSTGHLVSGTYYYAGGGGGGTFYGSPAVGGAASNGGGGVGRNGDLEVFPSNGTVNTGGGAGASGAITTGGSGLVIVRYPI